MIPDLVPGLDGYDVLPVGRHNATLDEVRAHFVAGRPDEDVRALLWQDFIDFIAGQAEHGLTPIAYWMDGSFISSKLNPGDVDFTAIIDGVNSNPKPRYLSFGNVRDAWKTAEHPVLGRTLKLDAFAIIKTPDEHIGFQQFLTARGYWDGWWQRSRATGQHECKGYLEVRP